MTMAKNFLRAISNLVHRDAAVADDAVGSVVFDGVLDDLDVAGLVEVRRGPIGDIAVDADRDTIVVTNHGTDCLTVINPDTLQVVGSVRLGGEPFAVVVADDRAYVSVATASHDAIAVVDTISGAVLAEYPLALSVTALTVSPDGKRVFAGRSGHDRIDVAVIDVTAERVGTIDIATGVGINLDALRVDATGKRLYAATSGPRGSRVVVVNTETARVEATVWIGAPVRDIALGTDGIAYALTSDLQSRGEVHVVDTAAGTVLGAIAVGGAPTQLVLSPDSTRAYVVDYDRVLVLCTLTSQIIGSVEVSAQPAAVAVRADGSQVFIADYAGHVNAFDVAAELPALYSQLTSAPVALHELAVREPVAV
ncbi:YncE family protein [Mycobacterium sp. 155]|uniref:MmpL3/TtfA transport complex stabilizer n=1 Tax=Mycobacterium sp. 155 TaxID=1157943 RepID=UPI0035100307